MSISAQEAVYRLPITDAVAKNILAYLAFRLNGGNGNCHPAIDRIARDTGFGRRSVIRKLQWLATNGYLAAERSNGRGNRYRLTFDTSATVAPPPVPPWHPTSATVAPKPKEPNFEQEESAHAREASPLFQNLSAKSRQSHRGPPPNLSELLAAKLNGRAVQ